MTTLYHSPKSRSSAILVLLHELGDPSDVTVTAVTIARQDGSGAADPRNPHPEKKVPYLVDGDTAIRERGAIILYLTDTHPSALAPGPGDSGRGDYLRWLFWYQGVFEPVAILDWAGITHPALTASFRDLPTAIAQIETALSDRPYLLGDSYSAADLLVSSPFAFFPAMIPPTGPIPAWVARCQDRDSVRRVIEDES